MLIRTSSSESSKRRAAKISPCPEAAPKGRGKTSSVWSYPSSTLTLLSLSLSPFQSLSLSLSQSAGPDTGPETAESQECSAHTRNEQVSTKTPKCFGAHLLTTNPPLHWLIRERDRDVNCQKTKRLKDRILQHPKTNPPSPPHLILKFDRWPPPIFLV